MALSIPLIITVAAVWIFVPGRNYSRGLVLLSILPLIGYLAFRSFQAEDTSAVVEAGRAGLEATQSRTMAFPSVPEPTQVFRLIGSNILTISMPFWRGGFLPIGARTTVVRTTSGKLAVFSPVSLTKAIESHVEKFGGKVEYLIAPDIEHHMKLGEWIEKYNPSVVIGPEGLPEKRKAAGLPDIDNWVTFKKASKLTQTVDEDFDRDFQYEYFESHPNKEIVFNFRPEKTMIQADLIFNMPATEQFSKFEQSFFGRWVNSAQGSSYFHRTLASYIFSRPNPQTFRDSINRVYKWDFDSIIPCHGNSIIGGGKEYFKEVMTDHIDISKPNSASPDRPATPNL